MGGRQAPDPAPAARSGAGEPTFALALGAGGARGLAHILAVEALDELGIRPVAVAGASIGAVMGAGVAAGMRGAEIREHARTVFQNSTEVAGRLWRARPESLGRMMADGLRLGQIDPERILRAFLPQVLPESFAQLAVPLTVCATDYYGHRQYVFEEGDLFPALAASVALPGVFRPVRHDGRLLIDGGMCNPVPFDLVAGKADITIAVDVVGVPLPGESGRPTAIDLLFGASQIMMQSITALKLRERRPQIMIAPPVSHFRVLDFLKVERVLAETAMVKDDLKRAVAEAVERRARCA